MIAVAALNENQPIKSLAKRAIEGNALGVFADIYQEDSNIVIWQRQPSSALNLAVKDLLNAKPTLQASMVVTPQNAYSSINETLGATATSAALSEDIAQLVDMFCCLFDLKRTGLRLTALDRAMCPRFHVDRVPCRLVTTYQGIATEWLPHHLVDRTKLGTGNLGKPDSQSGLFNNLLDIQQLDVGYVALLKGELWEGNEGAGLVHRSPAILAGEKRLLLTLDFN